MCVFLCLPLSLFLSPPPPLSLSLSPLSLSLSLSFSIIICVMVQLHANVNALFQIDAVALYLLSLSQMTSSGLEVRLQQNLSAWVQRAGLDTYAFSYMVKSGIKEEEGAVIGVGGGGGGDEEVKAISHVGLDLAVGLLLVIPLH